MIFRKFLENKRIFYLNLFFFISLYVISFVLKPNLILQNKYSYSNVPFNSQLLVTKYFLGKIDSLNDNSFIKIDLMIQSFMGSLINKKPLSILENCPKHITDGNFRDIIFYKLNAYNISIDIISTSQKASIQKCFETIFIHEFNKFYVNEIQNQIKIYSDINNLNQEYLNLLNKNDNSKIIYEYNFDIQTRDSAIKFFKNFNFIIDPNIKYQPTIEKKEINHVVIYLGLVVIFFLLQIIYFVIKKLNKYKYRKNKYF
jgi:hypothetical protein